jgi:hypothetical protein
MGCDIHMIVERRVNGKWERVERLPPRTCTWCDGLGHYENRPKDKCYGCNVRAKRITGESTPGQDCTPYNDRNYTVFSVLAGVRNDGYITPIDKPRGLPDDATHATGKDEDGDDKARWEHGDHSFTWLTLREVLDYDWKRARKDEGFVTAEVFKAWDANGGNGCPEEWCKGVAGAGIEQVTNSRMREYVADGMKEHELIERIAGKRQYYTLVQWSTSVADRCKDFLAFVESLAPLGEPENVRLVFGFDS